MYTFQFMDINVFIGEDISRIVLQPNYSFYLFAEKTLVSEPGQPTRIRRRYDEARTPFDRLLATESLSPEQRARLTTLRQRTNPIQLLKQIQEQLAYIFTLPPAQDGEDQIVYDTLTHIPDPRLEHAPVE